MEHYLHFTLHGKHENKLPRKFRSKIMIEEAGSDDTATLILVAVCYTHPGQTRSYLQQNDLLG